MSKVEDWKVETDLSVSKSVRIITSWKKELESLTTLSRKFSELVSHHDITEDEVEIHSIEIIFNRLKIDVKECIDFVEREDEYRELYTLDVSKTEAVKYPNFGGNDGEDFSKFKEDMEKAFVSKRSRVIWLSPYLSLEP